MSVKPIPEAYQIAAPDPNTPATHSVGLYCEDVDAVVAEWANENV